VAGGHFPARAAFVVPIEAAPPSSGGVAIASIVRPMTHRTADTSIEHFFCTRPCRSGWKKKSSMESSAQGGTPVLPASFRFASVRSRRHVRGTSEAYAASVGTLLRSVAVSWKDRKWQILVSGGAMIRRCGTGLKSFSF
jgi:hypothetical protein